MKLIIRTLRQLVPLLPERAQRFLWVYSLITSSLALIDVAALGLLALALSSMVAGRALDLPLVGQVEGDAYVLLIAVVSLLIILKSALSTLLQWRATRRFAQYELEVGDKLFQAYIRAPWTERLKRNTAQLVRLADVGIANTTGGFLLPVTTLPNLLITSLAVILVIFIAQPVTAMITVLYLGLIGGILYRLVSRRAVQAGRVNRDYSLRVASLMTDMVSALKEITLRDKSKEVAAVVSANRIHATRARSNVHFLSALPKFVLDSALVGGFLLVGGVAFLIGGVAEALSAVALFGVAGFRLVPSLIGLQNVITGTHSNAPHVQSVIDDIYAARTYTDNSERVGQEPLPEKLRQLEFRDVEFTYPGAAEPALAGVNLTIPLGSSLAIVGASGAGKTTLVDLLLGLLVPSGGEALIDDAPLEDVLSAWRSRVGYVPQEVAVFDGTVGQNVALTWGKDFDRDRAELALRRAQLWDFVAARPGGLDSQVGDRGMSFSGGQRQRLGIARALYGEPLVLVLDEATSALDTKTESKVVQAIRQLRGEVTVVSVAHRLSTIKDNDLVCFLSEGKLVAQGTFEELARAIPEFSAQVALASLAKEPAPGDD